MASSRELRQLVTLAIVTVVVSAWVKLLLFPENSSNKIKEVAGCYAGSGLSSEVVRLTSAGEFLTGTIAVKFQVNRDKGGFSISPAKRIFIDSAVSKKIELDSSYPDLLRLADDMSGFSIRDGKSLIFFHRARCSV